MILSAGLGTRLRPVTEAYPKPAVPFLNVPLLYYPFFLMREAGARSFVINTHHKPEQIEEICKRLRAGGNYIDFSHEPGAPLGSGGGIWKAKSLLEGSGDFFVANGDEVILPRERGTLENFVKAHKEGRHLATILVMRHPGVGTQFGGVWADASGAVKGFGKDPKQFPGTTGYHYIGLLLLSPRVFSYMPEGESNILYDTLAAAIAKGERVRVVTGDFTWYETGNPKDFLHATSDALKLHVEGTGYDAECLRAITHQYWTPGTVCLQENGLYKLVGESTYVSPAAKAKGFIVIGDRARIESGAVVENSVVMPTARVNTQAVDQIVLP